MRGNSTREANSLPIIRNHEKDMQLSIQLNRWILQPLGVWPKLDEISSIERYTYILVNVICFGLISFLFVPTFIFVLLEVEDMGIKLKLCGPLSFCLIAITKYSSLIFRKNDIRKGIENIKNDWLSTPHRDDRFIMIRNAKFGRRLVIICSFFMYGGATFYYIAMPFTRGKITDGINLTHWRLVFPVARVIVDARYNPINEIFFWVQCLSGFIVHSITVGACSLGAVFAMHVYGRMEVLMQWIEHLVDGREDLCKSVDDRLAIIVQHQVEILRFIELINKILREISAVEIVGCTLNMCFLGYLIITEWGITDSAAYITYVVLLISFTFNIFIFCYIGELVAEQCQKIGEVSYMIDWCRLPGRKGLALVLMIAMFNSSIKLTAANLFNLSLSTFGDVARTSVAYLNMLRTLTA